MTKYDPPDFELIQAIDDPESGQGLDIGVQPETGEVVLRARLDDSLGLTATMKIGGEDVAIARTAFEAAANLAIQHQEANRGS